MKSVCKTCTKRHWCELDFCPHKFFAYEIDADKFNKKHPHRISYFDSNLYHKHKALNQPKKRRFYNKECSLFLGDTVAETVLSRVFKNVIRTPPHNPGFDFWCNNKKKIDVKSSCEITNANQPKWQFVIRKNITADYFLCIAFDDRESLTPLHLWLIPGQILNHLSGFSIFQSTLHKWQEYELPLDKTVACCNTLRT